MSESSDSKFDLSAIQNVIREFGFDGWLLYDFRRMNVLALRVLEMEQMDIGSRRFFYWIPANGTPQKLVHRIESAALDHLPGEQRVYLRWQELHQHLREMLTSEGATRKAIAMEYSPRNANPYVSKVDAGTVELVRWTGVDVKSSGDLIQFFESRWSELQWRLHQEADGINRAAFEMAWAMIADHVANGKPIREMDVQNAVMQFYADHGMTTYHAPIVAVNENSGNPHYAPVAGRDSEIRQGDFVLLDMWAKLDRPAGVYSDLTKVGFVGDEVPQKFVDVFTIVAKARDAAIQCVVDAFAQSRELQGWEVDQAARDVIDEAGYGDLFIHRTGHNIGQETHGNGANMDNLETKEDRLVMRETCFSIEPGIYRDDFGIRSEINVYVDAAGEVHVTGGLQQEVRPILKT